MNSIDEIREIYKPYKYTIKGKCIILSSTMGDIVLKKRSKDIKELFDYLRSRSFINYPDIIDNTRDDLIAYKYVESVKMPDEQKAEDLIVLVSKLHNKTSYYKEVSDDKYKEIYDNIKSNIVYLKEHYNNIFDNDYNEVYTSPSSYLFLRNFTKINNDLDFCMRELDSWWELVKDSNKQRVCLIHNKLSLDHYLKNEDEYLISWDEATTDTPVLDIVNLYKNTYKNNNFSPILSKYLDLFTLHDDEKKLLFLLISLPWEVKLEDNEFDNCSYYEELFDYIYKTEMLIKPYYLEGPDNTK